MLHRQDSMCMERGVHDQGSLHAMPNRMEIHTYTSKFVEPNIMLFTYHVDVQCPE